MPNFQGIAWCIFQIIIPILLGVYFGIKLDEGKKFPLWTLILSLLGIAIGLYSFIKEVTKSKGKK